ncbi:MAG: hypothetical protein H7333_05895 [Bdellovibrionales bacterium]|nr:hypothetical protein [Oligoflexia bacterium]
MIGRARPTFVEIIPNTKKSRYRLFIDVYKLSKSSYQDFTKILAVVLSLSFVSTSTFAQTPPSVETAKAPLVETRAEPRDLQLVMDDLGAQFKIVKTQINDASLAASTILAAQAINPVLLEAVTITPESVLALPVDQQRAMVLQYRKLILQVSVANVDLEAELTAGNQDAAVAAFTKMEQLIGSGHSIFK